MLMPVPFDIFFWTLSLYLFLRFVNTGKPAPLLWFFAILGLGFLNKYNIVFLALPLGIFILSTNYRKLLTNRYFYIGIGLALLIILPNLLWQVANGLPVLRHMRELKESQLNNMSASTFLLEQLLMLFPATIIAIPGLIFLIGSGSMKQYRFIGIILLAIILIYLLLRGKSYYTAGIYPFLIAAGSLFFESWLRKLVPRAIALAAILFGGFLILPMGIPVFPPDGLVTYFDGVQKTTGNNSSRRFEDNSHHPLPQDYADMLGWDELTKAVKDVWQKVENKESCIIFADNYGEASAITILGKRYGLPEAISFNDAFRYWAPSTFPSEITDVIYINFSLGEDVNQLFGTVEESGGITNPLSREYGLKVFHCSRPLRSFNAFWAEAIRSVR